MRRRLKSAGLWLLVLALAAGSMALPWMVCRGYDRELFAQPRTRPATDLALSAAARENGFVSQLYERQRLLGGWSEGWEPLEGEAADAAAENARETLLELMKLENLPDGARQTVGEALAQSGQGLAWRDEMGFVRVWLGDVYLITEPVTGLPARLSVYGPADAPADPMALLDGLRGHVITCDEVGCGVVPLDRADEAYREAVGRLCCALAEEADAVVRVIAGVPQWIKGEKPCM